MSQLDRTGLFLSAACLVHCAALPLSVLLLPTLSSVWFDHSSSLHWLLLGLALPVSGYALVRGYREHREWPPMLVGVFGLGLMALALSHLLVAAMEIPLTVAGATIVAISHVLNIRLLSQRSG